MTMSRAVLHVLPVFLATSQQAGRSKDEMHVPMNLWTCTKASGCKASTTGLTMDAQWRWTHDKASANCLTANDQSWQPTSGLAAAAGCYLEGISAADYADTYGVTPVPGGVKLNFVSGESIGSRLYMMEADSTYKMFKLLNREFTLDVDVSTLECGLNGAVYFVEMQADGGLGKGNNTAGAKYGTGYCDAQCPHDLKFIEGEGNVKNWHMTKAGPVGEYGHCCAEMDVWEANAYATAYTTHACTTPTPLKCQGSDYCGDTPADCDCCDKDHCPCCGRYKGVCDRDGCDFNSFRLGDEEFYGKGKTVDTEQPLTVVTQFLTTDGTDDGDLKEIRRVYVQNGRVIQNSRISADKIQSAVGRDSITDDVCKAAKEEFQNHDDFTAKGGLAGMGASLKRGMVLVLSLWDDELTRMKWLDSATPSLDGTRTIADPGVKRGPCAMTAGDPVQLRGQHPSAHVLYKNIMVGEIGSTYTKAAQTLKDTYMKAAQAMKENPQPVVQPPPVQRVPIAAQPAKPVLQPPEVQQLPASVQPVQPVQQSQIATQPVQTVPAVPAALQPMTPAEEVTEGNAVNGFCCYYGPNPRDMCANCQSKDSSVWNANPANCAESGGTYCSGIVRLYSAHGEVPAIEGRLSTAQMPVGARLRTSALGAACGSLVMSLVFVRARRPWHDYTVVGGTNDLWLASEIQDGEGDFGL